MYLLGIGPGYRRDKDPVFAGRLRIGTNDHDLRLGWRQLVVSRSTAVAGGDEHVVAVLHAPQEEIRLSFRISCSLAAGARHQLFLSYCWTDRRPRSRKNHATDRQGK